MTVSRAGLLEHRLGGDLSSAVPKFLKMKTTFGQREAGRSVSVSEMWVSSSCYSHLFLVFEHSCDYREIVAEDGPSDGKVTVPPELPASRLGDPSCDFVLPIELERP